MFMNKLRYCGAVLAVATLMSANSLAQTPASAAPTAPASNVCSTLVGTMGGQAQASNPSTWSWGEGEMGYNPEPKPEPKPANPVQKTCADGKVRMVVGIKTEDDDGNPASYRHFGHTIMDKIPLTVVLDLDPSVQVDFSSLLTQRVIGFEGSDFTLYKPAAGEPPAVQVSGPSMKVVGVEPDPANPGKMRKVVRKVYVIDLTVQSMVFKPSIVFNLDLRYATEKLPDGKSPKWMAMTTPDFVVSRSQVVDNGEELLEGKLDGKAERLPWPTIALLATGIFGVFFFPGLALVKYLNRVRPRKVLPPNRMAWIVFENNYKDGKANGFKLKHMKAFSHALRRYLASTPKYPHINALTIEQIGTHFPDADAAELAAIKRAITACERELFTAGAERNGETPVSLNEVELHQLFADLSNLVPRTWDSK